VLVQEWFLRAAAAVGIAGPGASLHKMRVRKGLPLGEFGAEPIFLRVRGEPCDGGHSSTLALVDAAGSVRFVAEAAFNGGEPSAAPLASWPLVERAGSTLYGRELFHGPAFAALQTVEQLGEGGAVALLSGSRALGWTGDDWQMDPALIDGALQLARVWGLALLGKLTLPTACERLTIWRGGLAGDAALRCIVQGKSIGGAGTRSDLWIVEPASGTLVAEIRGLEMYASSEAPLP
jgi:hypothetical protein